MTAEDQTTIKLTRKCRRRRRDRSTGLISMDQVKLVDEDNDDEDVLDVGFHKSTCGACC